MVVRAAGGEGFFVSLPTSEAVMPEGMPPGVRARATNACMAAVPATGAWAPTRWHQDLGGVGNSGLGG